MDVLTSGQVFFWLTKKHLAFVLANPCKSTSTLRRFLASRNNKQRRFGKLCQRATKDPQKRKKRVIFGNFLQQIPAFSVNFYQKRHKNKRISFTFSRLNVVFLRKKAGFAN